MKLVPVPIEQIHACWGWVRNGLLTCLERSGQREIPEEFWASLMSGKSTLFHMEHSSDELGFVILQKQPDSDGAAVFVWAMWGEPGALEPHEAEIVAELDRVARAAGARRLRMQSARAGWAKRQYFTETARIYERELF